MISLVIFADNQAAYLEQRSIEGMRGKEEEEKAGAPFTYEKVIQLRGKDF